MEQLNIFVALRNDFDKLWGMTETGVKTDEELIQEIKELALYVENKCAEWTPKEQYHAWVRLARVLDEYVFTNRFQLVHFPKTRSEICEQEIYAIKKGEEMRQIIQGP